MHWQCGHAGRRYINFYYLTQTSKVVSLYRNMLTLRLSACQSVRKRVLSCTLVQQYHIGSTTEQLFGYRFTLPSCDTSTSWVLIYKQKTQYPYGP